MLEKSLVKFRNVKFCENPFGGSQKTITWKANRQTDTFAWEYKINMLTANVMAVLICSEKLCPKQRETRFDYF